MKKISVESTAEAYLELLAARGVEYFFANAGTDFAPLIEAYSKRQAEGKTLPRPLTVPHEITAIGMAHGFAMVTGRPQVVMVHVIVGTANALGGIINAARAIERAAEILAAARNPIVIAKSSGRDPGAVAPLVALAETLGVPVFDQAATHLNFPQDHPLYGGGDPTAYLTDADRIVVVEADAPWFPALRSPAPEATVIQIGHDPLFSRYPIRGFAVDLGLAGAPRLTIAALTAALQRR